MNSEAVGPQSGSTGPSYASVCVPVSTRLPACNVRNLASPNPDRGQKLSKTIGQVANCSSAALPRPASLLTSPVRPVIIASLNRKSGPLLSLAQASLKATRRCPPESGFAATAPLLRRSKLKSPENEDGKRAVELTDALNKLRHDEGRQAQQILEKSGVLERISSIPLAVFPELVAALIRFPHRRGEDTLERIAQEILGRIDELDLHAQGAYVLLGALGQARQNYFCKRAVERITEKLQSHWASLLERCRSKRVAVADLHRDVERADLAICALEALSECRGEPKAMAAAKTVAQVLYEPPLRQAFDPGAVAHLLNLLGRFDNASWSRELSVAVAQDLLSSEGLCNNRTAKDMIEVLASIQKWPKEEPFTTVAGKISARLCLEPGLMQSMDEYDLAGAISLLSFWREPQEVRGAMRVLTEPLVDVHGGGESLPLCWVAEVLHALDRSRDHDWTEQAALEVIERAQNKFKTKQAITLPDLAEMLSALARWSDVAEARSLALGLVDRLDPQVILRSAKDDQALCLSGLAFWLGEARVDEVCSLIVGKPYPGPDRLTRASRGKLMAFAMWRLSQKATPRAARAVETIATHIVRDHALREGLNGPEATAVLIALTESLTPASDAMMERAAASILDRFAMNADLTQSVRPAMFSAFLRGLSRWPEREAVRPLANSIAQRIVDEENPSEGLTAEQTCKLYIELCAWIPSHGGQELEAEAVETAAGKLAHYIQKISDEGKVPLNLFSDCAIADLHRPSSHRAIGLESPFPIGMPNMRAQAGAP